MVSAHNGCLHLEVEVSGASAHAGAPHTGRDALERRLRSLSDLYRARDAYAERTSAITGIASPTLVIGLISGGINTNVVPDRVTFRLDRRLIPEEGMRPRSRPPERAHRPPPPDASRVSLTPARRVLLAHPLVPVAGSETLSAALMSSAGAVLGEDIASHGLPIYTDARHYSAAGVPTVLYGAGPRTMLEANAHRADERLKLDDLEKATKVVALALLALLRDGP